VSQFRVREYAEDSSNKMSVWKGPFNVNCTSNKEPAFLMAEMSKALDQLKISFRKQGTYGVHCQSPKTTFTMELNTLEDLTNIFVVKFKRQSGDMRAFRETSSSILSLMTLI